MTDRMRAPEVAAELGLASTSTLYSWRDRGVGPRSYKFFGVLVWDRADVEAWVEQQKAATSRGAA